MALNVKDIIFRRWKPKTIDIWDVEMLYPGIVPDTLYGAEEYERRCHMEGLMKKAEEICRVEFRLV